MRRTAKRDIEYYMSLPYTIEITPCPDGGFFAKVKELEGCMTEGDTVEEVHEMIEDAKRAWIEAALEEGMEIPLPESMEEKYSGRILLRLPRFLHRRLAESAKKEGTSINTYVVSLLSEKNAEREMIRKVIEQLKELREDLTSSIERLFEDPYKDGSYGTKLNSMPKYKIITGKQIV